MNRITSHPILGTLEDKSTTPFQFDGKPFFAMPGDTVASALLANGVRRLRVHEGSGTPRGFYCNIGHCMECRVTVNGRSNQRACLTIVEKDMVIESGKQLPNIVKRMVEEQ